MNNIIAQIGVLFAFLMFFGSALTAVVGELAVENRIERADLELDLGKSLRLRKWGITGVVIAIVILIILMIANGMISITAH